MAVLTQNEVFHGVLTLKIGLLRQPMPFLSVAAAVFSKYCVISIIFLSLLTHLLLKQPAANTFLKIPLTQTAYTEHILRRPHTQTAHT